MANYPLFVLQQHNPAAQPRIRLTLGLGYSEDAQGEPIGTIYCAEGSSASGFRFTQYHNKRFCDIWNYCGRVPIGSIRSDQLETLERQLSMIGSHQFEQWAIFGLRRLAANGCYVLVYTQEALNPMLEETYIPPTTLRATR